MCDRPGVVLGASSLAAQGDMRREFRVCCFAHCGDPRCSQRIHRDTDREQLRLLVCGGRLHHARGHVLRLRGSSLPGRNSLWSARRRLLHGVIRTNYKYPGVGLVSRERPTL